VFIPDNTEYNKTVQIAAYGAKLFAVKGTYDTANRLAMQIAEECNWIFANHNVRPYYVEGSKTLAFEVCEQLHWTPPDHVIVPTGSGALLNAIGRGFHEFEQLNLIDTNAVKLTSAQPSGCDPIPIAFKKGEELVSPIECPTTIAKSLAIGDPGDGYYALRRIRQSGGYAESATDAEIIEGITLLARTEGLFTEPAGGGVIAVLKKLIENEVISTDETIVCYITGNGLKTTEAIAEHVRSWITIEPTLTAFHDATRLVEVPTWSP
jgi:threonine synthase